MKARREHLYEEAYSAALVGVCHGLRVYKQALNPNKMAHLTAKAKNSIKDYFRDVNQVRKKERWGWEEPCSLEALRTSFGKIVDLPDSYDPHEQLAGYDQWETMIGKMPIRLRTVMALCFEGKSGQDIGKLMGLSPERISQLLRDISKWVSDYTGDDDAGTRMIDCVTSLNKGRGNKCLNSV